MTIKTFIMLQKFSQVFEINAGLLNFHQRILKKYIIISTKILSSTPVFNMNVSQNLQEMCLKQQIGILE